MVLGLPQNLSKGLCTQYVALGSVAEHWICISKSTLQHLSFAAGQVSKVCIMSARRILALIPILISRHRRMNVDPRRYTNITTVTDATPCPPLRSSDPRDNTRCRHTRESHQVRPSDSCFRLARPLGPSRDIGGCTRHRTSAASRKLTGEPLPR